MQLQITGLHLVVTPALKAHVNQRLGKIQKHFSNITNIHITLSINKKFQQNAEAHIDLPGGNIFAKTSSEDMYATIDRLAHKLNRQVVKHKEKLKSHVISHHDVGSELLDTMH